MTEFEAQDFCKQAGTLLRLAENNSIYFESDDDCLFQIESPSEFREIGFLSRDLVQTAENGGMLWFHLMYGAEGCVEAGIRILDSIRQAQGDTSSWKAAPAQLFEAGELLDLQAALMQTIGNGWNAYFVPSATNFALSFRSSHRFDCYSDSKTTHSSLMALLKEWSPKEVNN